MVAELVEGQHEQPEDDVILSTHEAARLCHVSEERIRTLALDGRVPATMAHHLWSFSKRELERKMVECPEVLYGRRTPAVKEVTQARRERSRATMRRINAMRSREERRQHALRGYYGLLAKIAREVDPQNILPAEERERRVQMAYPAQMADARAKRMLGRKPTTLEERIALLSAKSPTGLTDEEAAKNLTICYGCWRDYFGGRPPQKLTNSLCERHQRENDEFAETLRGSGEE